MKYLNLSNEVALNLMGVVLDRLTALGLDVQCIGYSVYVQSGVIELRLKPPAQSRTRMSAVMTAAPEIALAAGYKDTRVYFGDTTVNIEIPAGHPKVIALQSLRTNLQPGKMLVGKTLRSQPLYVDLADSNTPHVLIAGTSGSGKSSLWHLMACTLALSTSPAAVKMAMYDPVHRNPAWLLRHVGKHLALPLMNDEIQTIERLRELSTFIDTGKRLNYRFVFFIDEVANLIDIGGDEVRQLLRHIAQKGRNSWVHLVLATQKPTAKLLDGGLISNLNCKLVLTVANELDSRIASGGKHIGAHLLPGRGAGVMVIPSETIRFTGGIPDGYDVDYGAGGGKSSTGTGVFGEGDEPVIKMPPTKRISEALQRAREVDAALLQAPRDMAAFLQQENPKVNAMQPLAQPHQNVTVTRSIAPAQIAPARVQSPEGDATGVVEMGTFKPTGDSAKLPAGDYSLGEVIEILYSRNPDISMGLLQKVLKVRGRADGFYVIKAELDKRGIKLGGMQQPA